MDLIQNFNRFSKVMYWSQEPWNLSFAVGIFTQVIGHDNWLDIFAYFGDNCNDSSICQIIAPNQLQKKFNWCLVKDFCFGIVNAKKMIDYLDNTQRSPNREATFVLF